MVGNHHTHCRSVGASFDSFAVGTEMRHRFLRSPAHQGFLAILLGLALAGTPVPLTGEPITPVIPAASDQHLTLSLGGVDAQTGDYWDDPISVLLLALDSQDDTDGDGIPNLLEYAFDLDPNHSDASAPIATTVDDTGHLVFTYVRRIDMSNPALDVFSIVPLCTVEVSGDLVTWHSGPDYTEEVSVTPIDANLERIKVRSLAPPGTAEFARLRVDLSSNSAPLPLLPPFIGIPAGD